MAVWEHGQVSDDIDAGPTDPGDLGRRVAFRREELGLTREELAARAGMSPGYLDYLEQHPAEVTVASVLRLAAALGTTRADLLGEGVGMPPGRGGAAARPVLETLSDDECRRLLAAGGIGRVVFVDDRGPVALPVNFAMFGDDVLFRTSPESPLAGAEGRATGFELDHIDDAMREGWSVLATGRLRRVTDPEELVEARHVRVDPWAGDEGRDTYVRVQIEQISGRRIRATT